MKTEENHYKIGLFVIGATLLLVAGLVFFGAGHWFQKKVMIESYFDESVQGLESGSPVKFQGLKIGEVESINTVAYLYGDQLTEWERLDRGRYVVVTMSITSYEAVDLSAETHADQIATAVAGGLRFRLASIGLTGTKFVEASYFEPGRSPALEVSWQPRHPYIPSAPDAINHIIDNVEELMVRLSAVDLEGMLINIDAAVVSAREAIDGLNTPALSGEVLALATELRTATEQVNIFLSDPALANAPEDAAAILTSTRVITASAEEHLPAILERFGAASISLESGLAQLDQYLKDPGNQGALEDVHALAANLRETSEELPDTIRQLRATLRDIQRMFGDNNNSVEQIFINLRRVSESLRSISAEMQSNPARVLFGDPPPPGPSNR